MALDPDIKDPVNWPGPNLFGDLLTMLRRDLLIESKVSEHQDGQDGDIDLSNVAIGSKRGYEPSGTTPPGIFKKSLPELENPGDTTY